MIKQKILNFQLILVFFITILFFIIGIYSAYFLGESAKFEMLNSLTSYIDDVVNGSIDFKLVYVIFMNNFKVCLILLISGITIFLPLVIIYTNGLMLGLINFSSSRIFDVFNLSNNYFIFKGVIIHGIPELSAIFLSAILGIYFGLKLYYFLYRYIAYLLFSDKRFSYDFYFKEYLKTKEILKTVFYSILKIVIFIIIPLLLIASILEVYITPIYLESSFDDSFTNFDQNKLLDSEIISLANITYSKCIFNENNSIFNVDTKKLLSFIVYDKYYNSLKFMYDENYSLKYSNEISISKDLLYNSTRIYSIEKLNQLSNNNLNYNKNKSHFDLKLSDFSNFIIDKNIFQINGFDCYFLFKANYFCKDKSIIINSYVCK